MSNIVLDRGAVERLLVTITIQRRTMQKIDAELEQTELYLQDKLASPVL